MSKKIKAAIIGSGNIGTDLMIKILRNGQHLEMGVMVGIDPESDGLARAKRMGVAVTAEGVEGLVHTFTMTSCFGNTNPTSAWWT
jgi:acetaldehyde dehydrogenase